jgi:hypothetical protein
MPAPTNTPPTTSVRVEICGREIKVSAHHEASTAGTIDSAVATGA